MFCTDASSHVADLTVFHNFLESIALSSRVFRIRFFMFGFLRFQSIFVFIYFESESETETERQRGRDRDTRTDREGETDRQRSGGGGGRGVCSSGECNSGRHFLVSRCSSKEQSTNQYTQVGEVSFSSSNSRKTGGGFLSL